MSNKKPSARLIKTNGEVIDIEPKNKKEFSLKELQKYVGGNIELVYTIDDLPLIINEEGRLDELEFNAGATNAYKYGHKNFIVGDAIIILNKETFK